MDVGAGSGTCAPGFGAVRDEFERNFAERGEVGAGLFVTVDGQPVVDLWGGLADPDTGRSWERDTRVVVYSNTKGATALCAHVLVDRGELDLEAPVGRYWPEFACNGKEDATVAMVLEHSAAVPAVSATLKPGDMYDWDLMCGLLAAQQAWWKPGTRNGYHLITYGWTVGELVRRVSGRSLGTFFRDEIAGPLDLGFDIGLPAKEESRVAPIIQWTPGPDFDSEFTRAFIEDPNGATATSMTNIVQAGIRYNSREFRAAEIGGSSGVATARGLGGMYTPLANGGGKLVGPDTLTRMSEVAVATASDAVLRIPTRFSLGFMKSMDNRRRVAAPGMSVVLSSTAFGHVGAGGSLGFADPAERLGFGYVMNRQGAGLLMNDRGQALVDRVYQALGYRTCENGVWVR
jgi:CubicO group peptidase (beta-lactamase class C family)